MNIYIEYFQSFFHSEMTSVLQNPSKWETVVYLSHKISAMPADDWRHKEPEYQPI